MVRAKFSVIEISKKLAMVDGRLLDLTGDVPGESHRIKLVPEFCFGDPDTGVSRVCPASEGSFIEIEMKVVAREGAEPFNLGQEYYIDFTPVKNDGTN